MTYLFSIFILCSSINIIAQDTSDTITKIEADLTGGNAKSWVFYKTVETMGSRQVSSEDCKNDTLTFDFASKTFEGQICKMENPNNNEWHIDGDDPLEQYIIIGERYMIDIFIKTIDEEKVTVLRLKQVSTSKSIPSKAYFYVETEQNE